MSMRKILAVINLDESIMYRNMETNGIEDTGDIDYVVGEINTWCEQCGISVDSCRILDDDDEADDKAIEIAETIFNNEETEDEADLVLEYSELLMVAKDMIVVDKDIFDDFVEDSYINIQFVDIEDDTIYQYIMVSESDRGITMRLLSDCV